VLLVCTVLLILTAGVVAIRTGVKSAWIFMLAWLGFLASCLIFLLSTHGIIPNNLLTRSAVEIGNTLEMLILAIAISDRVRELEVERLAALKRALHADRLQSLVKMICHDLTSPLSVVSTHAEIARSGGPASWDAVRRAVREQDRIMSFVRSHDSMLDVPVLGAGAAVVPVDLGEVMATLKFLFEGRGRTKGVELLLDAGADGLLIWGEGATLVHSVLGNAVSNAVKFSNRGSSVRVSVACEQEWVEICVEDQGVGMPQALQERIRAASKGVNRPGTQGEPGTGYGLGLMRHFTEAYGGSLSWTSRSREDGFEQTGTRLVFRFRRALAADLPQGSKSGTLGA
jgi:signal transduction histidine kinase